MSYRGAWRLVHDMNDCFRDPVIEAQAGGAHGGGTTLSPLGKKLIERYHAIEADAQVAIGSNPEHRDLQPRSSDRYGPHEGGVDPHFVATLPPGPIPLPLRVRTRPSFGGSYVFSRHPAKSVGQAAPLGNHRQRSFIARLVGGTVKTKDC
jgi:molybdate transport repressor ModE-like protein